MQSDSPHLLRATQDGSTAGPVRRHSLHAWLAIAALAVGLAAPSPARAEWVHIPFDVLFARPIAAAHVACGAFLFVPAALMSLPNGLEPSERAWDRFVVQPGQNLWGRPLGEF